MAVEMSFRFATIIFFSLNIGSLAVGVQNSHLLSEAERFARGTINYNIKYPKDCSGISWKNPSGTYIIKPDIGPHLVVLCDMDTDGGGWTVIQKNMRNNDLDWKNSWSTYKYGFGNIQGNHWLGNEYIHQITQQELYKVKFIIFNYYNASAYANYDMFSVDDEIKGYKLSLGRYAGTAGDSMIYERYEQDNIRFSTFDRDQDRYYSNCAHNYRGGWWFNNCYKAVLNVGVPYWQTWCCGNCRGSIMLIKPNEDICKRNE